MVLTSSLEERGGDLPRTTGVAREVIWHDLECGGYRADLPLWRELAQSSSGAILDVGAGTGRVTLDLARAGHRVTALERDPILLGALAQRAQGMTVRALVGDARTFQLRRRDFALCIVPMQTVQLLGGPTGRAAFLARARAHLRAGELLACAIVTDLDPFDCAAGDAPPSPETVTLDGRMYISSATRVRVRRRVIRIERERRAIPAGQSVDSLHAPCDTDIVELDRVTAGALEDEGRAAGFSPQPARAIAATQDHVGSTVVILRA
jgi:SAM-dependent methyltransferase